MGWESTSDLGNGEFEVKKDGRTARRRGFCMLDIAQVYVAGWETHTAQGGSSLKSCAVAKLISITSSARILTFISITVSYHNTRKLLKGSELIEHETHNCREDLQTR